MKQTIFIIAIILSSISSPVMANANDSTEVNTTNPILKKEELKLPWYKALKYEIGYSGGLCYTGKDLMKYTDFNPLAFANPSNYLYWLNSVEISAIYPLGNKKGVEVGVGYGWASIHPSRYDNWEFKLPLIFLGYKRKKITLKGKYIFIIARDYGKVSGSIPQKGKGNGYSFTFEYKINKYVHFILNLGGGNYLVKAYYPNQTSEYNVNMCFNGIGFSLTYNFNLKGGENDT